MREYELTVVFDLSIVEAGGADAAPNILTQFVEARGGKILKHDHWGRRRMAYPINHALDADYVVSRVEIDPAQVTPLEAALKIDERIYRHLIVRADELPPPPPPREPRQPRPEAEAAPVAQPSAAEAAEAAVAAPSPVAEPETVAATEPAAEEVVEPVVPAEEPSAITPAASEAGEPPEAPQPDVETPLTDAPAAAVESPATEAEAAAEAGTDDEAPSA